LTPADTWTVYQRENHCLASSWSLPRLEEINGSKNRSSSICIHQVYSVPALLHAKSLTSTGS
jgi:hypothetical protein